MHVSTSAERRRRMKQTDNLKTGMSVGAKPRRDYKLARLTQPFDAHCCHMGWYLGTSIEHPPVTHRVKPSFGIFDILAGWHSGAQGWASECLDVKNYKWRLNPVGIPYGNSGRQRVKVDASPYWQAGSHWRSLSTEVMCSRRRVPVTSRVATGDCRPI